MKPSSRETSVPDARSALARPSSPDSEVALVIGLLNRTLLITGIDILSPGRAPLQHSAHDARYEKDKQQAGDNEGCGGLPARDDIRGDRVRRPDRDIRPGGERYLKGRLPIGDRL